METEVCVCVCGGGGGGGGGRRGSRKKENLRGGDQKTNRRRERVGGGGGGAGGGQRELKPDGDIGSEIHPNMEQRGHTAVVFSEIPSLPRVLPAHLDLASMPTD